MLINLIRTLLLVGCVAVGRHIGPKFGFELSMRDGAITGAIGALIIIGIERIFRKISVKELGIAVSGLILGLLTANLLSVPFYLIPIGEEKRFLIPVALNFLFGYMGLVMGLERKRDLTILPFWKTKMGDGGKIKLLDTNIIIDGRICDIGKAGFLGGNLVIPRFVLNELHGIADCPDSLKRKRGRRGLDILNKLRKDPNMNITIQDMDFQDIKSVDAKLVKLAKVMNADIITNDYNLNKIAELESVKVLNLNELANAMKPVVLPGEIMSVKIAKEGKEHSQGVGYLDDGTMVVVEGARKSTGLTIDIIVTSVLQTAAGKMIFAKLRSANDK